MTCSVFQTDSWFISVSMLALNSGHTIGNIGDPDLIGPHDVKLPLYAIRGNNRRSASDTTWAL